MTRDSDTVAGLGWFPVRVSTRRTPSSEDLDHLEARLGGALPDDYRRFVTRYGEGGVRDKKWFPIAEPCPWGQWGLLDQFLGFSTDPRQGLEGAALDVYADQIPAGTLPIAADPGGNLLLLATTGAAVPAGSIWFWDHEHRPRAPEPNGTWKLNPSDDAGDDNLYAVAPSFSALLESLRADKA